MSRIDSSAASRRAWRRSSAPTCSKYRRAYGEEGLVALGRADDVALVSVDENDLSVLDDAVRRGGREFGGVDVRDDRHLHRVVAALPASTFGDGALGGAGFGADVDGLIPRTPH